MKVHNYNVVNNYYIQTNLQRKKCKMKINDFLRNKNYKSEIILQVVVGRYVCFL